MRMVQEGDAFPGIQRSVRSQGELGGGMLEFESQLITVNHAFQRWASCCMSACGMKDLAVTDILVLHHVNHRARGKKLADIAFILNIEDTHVVNYSLKKLQSLGLVQSERHGKEVLYATSERGQELCRRYQEVREQLLVPGVDSVAMRGHDVSAVAHFLRVLSGLYDQAARSAATI